MEKRKATDEDGQADQIVSTKKLKVTGTGMGTAPSEQACVAAARKGASSELANKPVKGVAVIPLTLPSFPRLTFFFLSSPSMSVPTRSLRPWRRARQKNGRPTSLKMMTVKMLPREPRPRPQASRHPRLERRGRLRVRAARPSLASLSQGLIRQIMSGHF